MLFMYNLLFLEFLSDSLMMVPLSGLTHSCVTIKIDVFDRMSGYFFSPLWCNSP